MRTRTVIMALMLLGAPSCSRHQATPVECDELVDRLVALELRQAGFRDPALEKIRSADLHGKLSTELSECQRLEFPRDVLACSRQAKTTEELAHRCLR